jgi:hypothetical protein
VSSCGSTPSCAFASEPSESVATKAGTKIERGDLSEGKCAMRLLRASRVPASDRANLREFTRGRVRGIAFGADTWPVAVECPLGA